MYSSHSIRSRRFITGFTSAFFDKATRRKLISLSLIFTFLVLPMPDLTTQFPALVSSAARISGGSLQKISAAFLSLFTLSALAAQSETMEERSARVSEVRVTPPRFVGYLNESVAFAALGLDSSDKPVHGAKFTWESSNTDKLDIDEAGNATFIQPGLATITCRAGTAQATATVLIRPRRRALQSDSEWWADQDGADASGATSTGAASLFNQLAESLSPTALAQGGGQGADFASDGLIGQVGTPPHTALEETRLGPVKPQENFNLIMPLVSLGGRGLAANLNLYYNSNVWGARFDPSTNTTVYTFDPIQGWPGPGFSLGFGRIVIYDGYVDISTSLTMYKYMLIDPNGTRHALGTGSASGANTLKTTDGTNITYVGNVLGGSLYYSDGTKVTIGLVNNRRLPTRITDTNGNYIQIAYKSDSSFPGIALDYIVDTLGRVIQFNYNTPNSANLTSISTPVGTINLTYQTVTMNHNFQSEVTVENAPASFPALASVSAPERPQYQFSYSGYGMIYNISLNGGSASVTYNYPLGGEEIIGGPAFTQRTESPNAVYTYTPSQVTRPDGSKLILSGTERELKNSSNATLYKTVYTYANDPGGSKQIQSTISYDDAGKATRVDFDYDQYGNVVNQREYGHQISGAWQVRRRTHYTYVTLQGYVDAYIRNLVQMIEVYDARQNTSDADDLLIGRAAYEHDNYTSMGGMESYGGAAAPPGHLSSYNTTKTARGNVTGVTEWSDLATNTSIKRDNKRDIFGNIVKAQVSCCSEKTFTHGEGTYWTKPTQVTRGDLNGAYLTTSASYDFDSLAVISETDPNSQMISYDYDSQMRPTAFTSNTGASGTTAYNVWGGPTSSSVTYSEGGVTKTVTETATYGGWGQLISSVDANGAQVNYGYDTMGRMTSQTNPFSSGGQPGPATSYQYDQLGRVTVATLPDGNTIQTAYVGSVVTATDQVGRKTKREIDGLGRLIKVTEQDSSGALAQDTSYTYDAADRLTQVSQGGQARAFKYDTAGRLIYEKIPEHAATINDGTGTMWSSKYTYTSWGDVATRQDARGVITTYAYDSLHRLTGITYNTSGASGVVATPNVTYTYETSQASNTKGLLLSVSAGSGYSESYSYDGYKRVSGITRTIDGRSYTTSYQMNTASQLTQITYPSGRVINQGRDNKGRITSIGGYLTGVTYNGIGQVTGVGLGNGVNETYGYDAQRMQLTTQTATKGATTLMSLTYGYQAQAGQMGAGTTAGNSGQLMSISGSINGQAESASYTYDLLGRLATSNQTSNAQNHQRRFSYDRWGNRTAMWNAVSGGTLIQAMSYQQSGGAPTNRVLDLSIIGSTVSYIHDSAGNVTSDGQHTYQYDAENRVASADNGASGSYAYDHNNRRVKKALGSAVTHYVWDGSQSIAEHNGSTGGVVADYIYSGSRMVARASGGAVEYYLSDRLSKRLVLDALGNVTGRQAHLPYGEEIAGIGQQEKHHFTSYERDPETGIDYAINRGYVSATGRFLQSDPYKASGFLVDPQSWNRYGYVHNDPVNFNDELGLFRQAWNPLVGGYPGQGPQGGGSHNPIDPGNPKDKDKRKDKEERNKEFRKEAAKKAEEKLGKQPCGDYMSDLIRKASLGVDQSGGRPLSPVFASLPPSTYALSLYNAAEAAGRVSDSGKSGANGSKITYGVTDRVFDTTSSGSGYSVTTKWNKEFYDLNKNNAALHIIHEALHHIPNYSDELLAQTASQIAGENKTFTDQGEASRYLNEKIAEQCK